jgi:hypothetical protein
MSLKILFDPIYSGHLDRCSTAFKYRSIVEHNLAQGREDWFYYWVIPPRDTLTEEELAWLPQAPQIRYLEVVNLEDRMREYMRFTRDLDFIYGFNGDYWDWDVVVTVRTSQIANMRAVMSSPRQVTIGRKLKKVICLEEMLIIDRKKTVAKSDIPAQELLTVAGYLCADLTLVAGKADLDDMNHTAPAPTRGVLAHQPGRSRRDADPVLERGDGVEHDRADAARRAGGDHRSEMDPGHLGSELSVLCHQCD